MRKDEFKHSYNIFKNKYKLNLKIINASKLYFKKLKNIKKSALKTVKNYTWEKRIDKIINFANEKIYD